MSFRGQQTRQQQHGSGREARPFLRGENGVLVFPYCPIRDVACGVMKVPYGEVYVDGFTETLHSNEIRVDGNDRSVFIRPVIARAERDLARRDREKAREDAAARRENREKVRAAEAAEAAEAAASAAP